MSSCPLLFTNSHTLASVHRHRLGGMAGAVSNMAAAAGIGYVLQFTGNNYNSLLTVCSFAYVAALGVIHWLVPRLEPAKIESTQTS